jgi:hypothetical protein
MEMNVLRVTAKAKYNDSIFRKHKNEFDYNLLNIFIESVGGRLVC